MNIIRILCVVVCCPVCIYICILCVCLCVCLIEWNLNERELELEMYVCVCMNSIEWNLNERELYLNGIELNFEWIVIENVIGIGNVCLCLYVFN